MDGIARRSFLAAAGVAAAAVGTGLSAGTARAGFADRVSGIEQDDAMQTIGLGVSVQERFFNKFKEDTGLDVTGTVAGLSEMISKFITGGNKTYSMIETNAYRQPALRETVNLLAFEEVWGMDCWNPVVEDVKKRGIPCRYVDVFEGTAAWVHTMCLSSEAPEPEVAMAYMDWCLDGWWGSAVAPQGYYFSAA